MENVKKLRKESLLLALSELGIFLLWLDLHSSDEAGVNSGGGCRRVSIEKIQNAKMHPFVGACRYKIYAMFGKSEVNLKLDAINFLFFLLSLPSIHDLVSWYIFFN